MTVSWLSHWTGEEKTPVSHHSTATDKEVNNNDHLIIIQYSPEKIWVVAPIRMLRKHEPPTHKYYCRPSACPHGSSTLS